MVRTGRLSLVVSVLFVLGGCGGSDGTTSGTGGGSGGGAAGAKGTGGLTGTGGQSGKGGNVGSTGGSGGSAGATGAGGTAGATGTGGTAGATGAGGTAGATGTGGTAGAKGTGGAAGSGGAGGKAGAGGAPGTGGTAGKEGAGGGAGAGTGGAAGAAGAAGSGRRGWKGRRGRRCWYRWHCWRRGRRGRSRRAAGDLRRDRPDLLRCEQLRRRRLLRSRDLRRVGIQLRHGRRHLHDRLLQDDGWNQLRGLDRELLHPGHGLLHGVRHPLRYHDLHVHQLWLRGRTLLRHRGHRLQDRLVLPGVNWWRRKHLPGLRRERQRLLLGQHVHRQPRLRQPRRGSGANLHELRRRGDRLLPRGYVPDGERVRAGGR